jgi:hypothetical protein
VNDLHERDWDDWGAVWRLDADAPASRPLTRSARPARRNVFSALGETVLHLGFVGVVLCSVLGAGPVEFLMRLSLAGAVLYGLYASLHARSSPVPSGYDSLATHLERVLLERHKSLARLRSVAVVLIALVVAGGPGTWAAWETLDGDSAIPYLPPVGTSLMIGGLALVYLGWIARRFYSESRETALLGSVRMKLLEGVEDDEDGRS